jgi:hypothetical protein
MAKTKKTTDETDPVKAYLRAIGSKGGSKLTPAKIASNKANIAKRWANDKKQKAKKP